MKVCQTTFIIICNYDYSDKDWAKSFILLINIIDHIVVEMLKIFYKAKSILPQLRTIQRNWFAYIYLVLSTHEKMIPKDLLSGT